jgi:hypothetical protein
MLFDAGGDLRSRFVILDYTVGSLNIGQTPQSDGHKLSQLHFKLRVSNGMVENECKDQKKV